MIMVKVARSRGGRLNRQRPEGRRIDQPTKYAARDMRGRDHLPLQRRTFQLQLIVHQEPRGCHETSRRDLDSSSRDQGSQGARKALEQLHQHRRQASGDGTVQWIQRADTHRVPAQQRHSRGDHGTLQGAPMKQSYLKSSDQSVCGSQISDV